MSNQLLRLNKFLAERLGVSRREADELIVAGKITIDFDNALTNFCSRLDDSILLPLLHNEDTLKVTSGTTSYVIISSTIYNELQESSADNFAHYRDRELSDYIDYTEHFKQHPEYLQSTNIIRILQYLQFLGLRDM